MSERRKSPQEKKSVSLKKDRRNTYGENDKSSRKNIPLSKAHSHRQLRRKSAQLEKTWQSVDVDESAIVESTLTKNATQKPYWKKVPDTPLGEVLEKKLKRRQQTIEDD